MTFGVYSTLVVARYWFALPPCPWRFCAGLRGVPSSVADHPTQSSEAHPPVDFRPASEYDPEPPPVRTLPGYDRSLPGARGCALVRLAVRPFSALQRGKATCSALVGLLRKPCSSSLGACRRPRRAALASVRVVGVRPRLPPSGFAASSGFLDLSTLRSFPCHPGLVSYRYRSWGSQSFRGFPSAIADVTPSDEPMGCAAPPGAVCPS